MSDAGEVGDTNGSVGGSVDLDGWSCPVPLRDHDTVVLGHGGGGRLSRDLVEHLFLPAFAGSPLAGLLTELGDAAVLGPDALAGDSPSAHGTGGRLAFTTDAYVVRPRFFPGGCIGDLAVNGTVNDLAVTGARPVAISVAAICEEGLPLPELATIAQAIGAAARAAGVSVVTGDTKVVERGHGDGLYLTTAGIGVLAPDVRLGPGRIRPGDAVLVSGPIGRHGIAVLGVREGLEFASDITSDTAPIHTATAALLGVRGGVRGGVRDADEPAVAMMRDATRGGIAAVLTEMAQAAGVGIAIEDAAVPVPDGVRAACGLLGLDPLYVANEGTFVAVVRPDRVAEGLAALRATPVAAGATRIGTVTTEHPGIVVARSGIGGTRVVDLPLAEQLPRIC